jgi:hypothetical protein
MCWNYAFAWSDSLLDTADRTLSNVSIYALAKSVTDQFLLCTVAFLVSIRAPVKGATQAAVEQRRHALLSIQALCMKEESNTEKRLLFSRCFAPSLGS